MNNDPTPQLPESDKHGKTLGIVAACGGIITLLAAAAAAFLLLQSEEIVSQPGLVLGGISALLGLISLFLGIVATLSIQGGNRVPAFVGAAFGCLGLILVIPLMGTVSYRVTQRKLVAPEIPPIAPLVIRETARTEKENDQLWHQWFEENLEQPMKARLSGKPWEKEGLEVIGAFPNTWLWKGDKLGELEWQRLAASLVKKKCDDPTLLHLVSRSSDVGVRTWAYLINSSKGIGTSELNPLWAFIAEMDKAEMTEYSKKDEERLPSDAEVIRRLKRSCEAGCFEGEKIWLLGRLLTESSGAKFSDRNGGKIADVFEKTGMPEWTVHWMRGQQEIEIAWDFRGSGYSSKVTEEGWKGFREHLKLAREELTKSWELAPDYPFAATSMITVCRGDSNEHLEEMRLWLDRAMAAQVDNWRALSSYKTGLYPKWHGSHEMMLEFAERCLETERFDTWIPWMYLDVSKYLASRSSDKTAYYADEEVYANLMALLNGYLTAAKTEAEKQEYLTYQMVFSRLAGHSDNLPDLWEKLKGKPDDVVLGKWQLDREDFELSILLDRENIKTRDVEELTEQGFYDDASFYYQAISDQEGLTEPEQLALKRQMSLLELRGNWETSEWVTLWPTETPELWRTIEGERLPDAGGTLKFRSDTFRYVFEHALILGKEYELEVEMGPLQDTRGTSGSGVWIGKRPWSDTRWNSMTLHEIGKNKYAIRAAHWRYRPAWEAKTPKKNSVLLHLECRGKDWTVSADGKVQNTKEIKMRLYDSGRGVRLVLGGYVQPEHKTVITYKSIRVRKLESPEE